MLFHVGICLSPEIPSHNREIEHAFIAHPLNEPVSAKWVEITIETGEVKGNMVHYSRLVERAADE